jgi:preprotein translocase subunit SecA
MTRARSPDFQIARLPDSGSGHLALWPSGDLNDRLWPALARPFNRRQPPKGADAFGEWTRAVALRRKAGATLRREAARVLDRAAELARFSEAALDESIPDAAARVRIARDDPAAIREAYAHAHEVIRREIGLSLYPEQVMGALEMARGRCVEMATGEGKTVTAILPAALEGWTGRGAHVVTVNDYLARRDAKITSSAYQRLGLTVGVLQGSTLPHQRRRAYACAITYGADKEFIFDFLRDRLISPLQPRLSSLLLDQLAADGSPAAGANGGRPIDPTKPNEGWSRLVVQRELHAAIVDEADSVLIDEGITPAIIGQDLPPEATEQRFAHYRTAAKIAPTLARGRDYTVDHRLHRTTLTEAGRKRLAEHAASLPPFWAGPRRREEVICQALTAHELYKRDDDYIVKDGQIVIVDRSTGRLLEGRKWQLGLHQAVEAKEGLDITDERRTTARVSYQRFFQRYRRLSGMTGTAWEVAPELWKFYRLPVVRIPTHKPMIRQRARDRVFTDRASKFAAVADRVAELHAAGRPVLVGTRSVEASEELGRLLADRGVPCRILNAVREDEEAQIVAEAGRVGAVTVATNMAGRGTDIILDGRARELGGLVVIATERHDEPRVDRQLFGRAGRQGDPGLAEVYVSMDDQLIKRHGLAPLAALCRAAPLGLRRAAAAPLWSIAQYSAGRRSAVLRGEVAKHDAWIDMAMHHHSR